MPLNIAFTVEAKADLDELRIYLNPLNPTGLKRVVSAVEKRILLAAEYPASGRQSPRDDVREAIEVRYGFLNPYLVKGNTLFVLRIYRGVRKPLDYELLPSPDDV
jgi:toxin ParE1/3/4